MHFTGGYLTTSIGKKLLVAISGLLILGFVILHMVGNLQIFSGPEKLNAYAKFLKDLGPLLWLARIGLIVFAIVHIVLTIQLTRENRKARPNSYVYMKTVQASSASRFMILSGLTILSFIIYHLLHFTLGVTNPEYAQLSFELNGERVHDVYAMVVNGFTNPIVSGFYILSMGLLCWHISHGVSSLFQTLGITNAKNNKTIQQIATSTAGLIFIGNISIPITILAGIIK
ncbi:MAG: succinate dehydrogenase cytochrome b subunit [Leptospiraceae bacterium]|nr:succinate dehydrogenase cytochrome b subunit [Leptospiraceae bacterium]